ncbi:MAG: helix-turn-helix domain-containing protein [Oscillospiraceae bacterium]|nr:helix-turn-helix domain-containing protein [Oscillospiraceae bacterium]
MTPNLCFENCLPKDALHPYTLITNDRSSYAWDTRLSPMEVGILVKVFSLCEESWHFSVSGFQKIFSIGKTKIRTALKKLEQLGYLFIEKRRDKKGRFIESIYHFYEVAMSPEEKNKNNEKGVSLSFCPRSDFPHPDIPDTEIVSQLTTNPSNKNLPVIKSLSVSSEMTDGLNEEPSIILSSNSSEQFTALEELITSYSDCDSAKQELKAFVPEITKYLENSVESQSIELEEIISKLKEIISKEGSLFAFIKKIKHECEKALKKLKYPSAKENYLTSTIRNQLKKYSPKSPELDKHSESVPKKQASEYQGSPMPSRSESEETSRTLSLREMLFHMGSPLLKENLCHADTIFSSEEEFKSYYGEFDPDEWAVRDCWIPDFFQNNTQNLENALRFLTGYSDLPSDSLEQSEYKEFVGKTIHLLAKALYTKKTSYSGKEILNTDTLISRLNYINADMNDHEDSLRQFMRSFYERFKRKIAQYPIQTNEESYITLMLVNYLNGEYQAEDMIGIGKGMTMLDSFK